MEKLINQNHTSIKQKIIFLDIDGTLTEAGSNIPPKTALAAIEKTRALGNYVFLCTGRNYQMLSPLLEYEFDGYIASSGGYVKVGEQVIFDCPMTKEERNFAFDVFKKYNIYRTVECLQGSYTDEGFKEFLEQHASEKGNSELLRWRKQIEKNLNIRPMSEYAGDPVYKIVFMGTDLEKMNLAKQELENQFLFCLQDMDQYGILNGELINQRFHKGTGVKMVAEKLGIPLENTIGYGDSMNDKEMLEVVGHAICMGNGSQTLQNLADEVCGAVTEDGLYHSFVKMGLLKKESDVCS